MAEPGSGAGHGEWIDLGREPAFDLGAARVRPAYRDVVAGPTSVLLQPRVMQVLVCLAQGGGDPVSRDVLVHRCWGGVTVSEDAINRCIQRLRRLSKEEAADAFAIETIPRVGFRLRVRTGAPASDLEPETPVAAQDAGPPPASVCVVPFVNTSGEAEQEDFSDGVSEDIISDLGKVPALSVVARTAAFGFKGKTIDAREVAAQLNVRYVITGSVRKAEGRVRISAQLIDGATGDQVWAERYDGAIEQIFPLQDEISQGIVGALRKVKGSIGDLTVAERDSTARGERAAALSGTAPIAERKTVTVLFADIRDWLDRQGDTDPEEALALTDPAVRLMTEAVLRRDGHVVRTTDDGVLAVFGAPQAREGDPQQAIHAALEIRDDLKRHWAGLHRLGEPLEVRIGVSTGEVVVRGGLAADGARDFDPPSGPVVGLASRLQLLAPTDSIVIGPATESLVRGFFELEDMGSHPLKGVSEPLNIWRVLSRTDASRFDIRAERGLTPMVGRRAELEMLRQRWEQSCDGEMRCVLLVGEPGIGKSRALRALGDSIQDADHQTLTLQCSSYHRDSAFWPVLQMLQRSFGLDPTTPADAGQFEGALAGFTVNFEETVLVLSNLLDMPPTARYPKIDTSQIAFRRLCMTALAGLVGDMARRQPVLLVVEDAHWIDPSTLELVRSLIERLTASRLLLAITARPEFKPDWHYPHLLQLNLDRLSRRDSVEMIVQLTGGKPLPDGVLDQMVAKTDGVPLFIEELTKTIVQGGQLRDTGARYELNRPLPAISIPDTLQDSLLSRLDRLKQEVKEIAQIASAIGREFQRHLLALIAAKPDTELLVALGDLTAADIILPAPGSGSDGDAFLFRHALIQDIAYQSMLVARRRQLHGRIAEALERHYADVVERQPELIAQNLASSDHPERAIHYWKLAGERALARAAVKEALAHAEAGLRLVETAAADSERERAVQTIPLLLIRAQAEFGLGGLQSISTYQRVAQMARTHNLPAFLVQAALEAAVTVTYVGKPGVAISLLEEALAANDPGDSLERCRLLSRLTNCLRISGSFERADEIASAARALALRINDESSLILLLGCELMHVGANPLPIEQFPERRRVLDEIERLSGRVRMPAGYEIDADEVARAYALCAYLEIGDYAGFEADRAKKGHRRTAHGFSFTWLILCLDALAGILVGDFAEAELKAGQAARLADSLEVNLPTGVYGMQMFTIRREQGRLAEVAPVLKRLVDQNPEDSTWRPGLMLIASDLGFEAPALANLERIVDGGFAIPADGKRLVTWTYIAEVAARLRKDPYTERVYKHLLPFRDQAVTVPVGTLCVGSAARYLGLLATALGDWSAAEAHFEYALEMNERLRAWPWLAHTRHEYGLMLLARNRAKDQRRAADLIASASATARELNMSALVESIAGAARRVE
jgi:TolB-like protein/class 3 adenylate cyclase/tetratricopeptide (TPR) repeat protein